MEQQCDLGLCKSSLAVVLGLIFQPNVCDLLCLTGKFTATSVHNKGPNALCVPDSDNSSHRVVTTNSAVFYLTYFCCLSFFQ